MRKLFLGFTLATILIGQAAYSDIPDFPPDVTQQNPVFTGHRGMVIPEGTTAERRNIEALVRINKDTGKLEWFSAVGGWQEAGGGTGGGDGSTMPIALFSSAGIAIPGVNFCNATSAPFTITVPSAIANSGRVVEIKKTDVTNHVVTVQSSQLIDSNSTYTLYSTNQSVSLISDGANWKIK